MDAREAKNLVYELLRLFFAGAAVTFSKQSNTVRPSAPLVTLTTVSLKRPLYPPQKIVDGIPVSYYPTRMRMQADLYTKGAPVDTDPGYLMPMENTALSDLTEFSNFLGSEYVVNWCHRHDVALSPLGDVQDTTALINDTAFEFRATLQLEMDFTQKAVGYVGILSPSSIKHSSQPGDVPGTGFPAVPAPDDDEAEDVYIEPEFTPSASGGGTEELAKESIGYFTEAEITSEEGKQ